MYQEIISEVVKNKAAQGGVKQVFFIACGGSLTAYYASKYYLESESKALSVGYYSSNEFVHATPARLGPNSVVFLSSHRGNTPETVEAAKIAKARGATNIVLTYINESPITAYADHVVNYEWGDDIRHSLSKPGVALRLTVELLEQVEGTGKYAAMQQAFAIFDEVTDKAKEQVQSRAEAFASECVNASPIYVMSSGAGWGSAHQESICVLLEMQWIDSSSVHSGEYFHGPFEITDQDKTFILMMTAGRTRPLDERALKFLKEHCGHLYVIDAVELGAQAFGEAAEFVSGLLLTSCIGVYNRALAKARNHPLTDRRYMWKLEY